MMYRVVTALACWLAACAAAGSMTADLQALGAVSVNYSRPVINATYVASVQFDMRAMGPIYNNSHYIIDAILQKDAYPEGFVTVSDGHVELSDSLGSLWQTLLRHYAGASAFIIVALLVVVLMPLSGLLWCCCRACRTRPRRPFDRKYDACWKAILAILLIALLTILLFGIVCLFATETQEEAGLAGSGTAIKAGATDAATFLDTTQQHARWLLVVNFNELERRLQGLLASAPITTTLKLGEASRGSSVSTLHAMAEQLDTAAAQLQRVRNLTESLRAHAEQLNAALRHVRAQLLQTLAKCDQPQCRRLQEKHRIGQLDTEIHYSQMPDVTALLEEVSAISEDGGIRLIDRVNEGEQKYRKMQGDVQRAVEDMLPTVHSAIADIGKRLSRVADEVTWQTGNASETLRRHSAAASDTLDAIHGQYGVWRRLVARALAASLTVCAALMAGGLVCGVCGRRPDHYGRGDCCNKGAGSRCLLCGVAFLFIAGALSALAVVVYFCVGGAMQRLVCDPLVEPRDNRLFADVEKFVDFERLVYNSYEDPDFNMTYVMVNCHRNNTLYETFQLRRVYDIEALVKEVSESMRSRTRAVAVHWRDHSVRIMDRQTEAKLTRLADSQLSQFDFDKILDALETNMTSLSLLGLSEQLEQSAAALQQRAGFGEVSRDLYTAAQRLRAAHHDILLPMLADTQELNNTALTLRDGFRFNHSSLKDAIKFILREINTAEVFLATRGPAIVNNITLEFAEMAQTLVEEYLERIRQQTYHEIGRCGPLSHAFNATRDAHCQAILMPLNGYWIALCWCLVLLVPMMAVSVRLARLYRSLDPYPGPLVEAEYLYDAYADRDNVPLANAYKTEKRSGGGGGAGGRGEGRRGAGGSGAAAGGGGAAAAGPVAVPPPADGQHARRYNDMAPKHWEEGPPRYLGPTEYERPPPYYYPGPNDRQ